ncbi:MAG: MBL fold metallo-hydrolase [Nitrospinales bacterium]
MKLKFWGVRGSVPSGSRQTAGVGGNTTCLEIRCRDNLIILDSGTGIRDLGRSLMKRLPVKAKIFFTHVHWDHIQGWPFFAPLYVKENAFEIYGGSSLPVTIEETLKKQMTPPFFPVEMDLMGASMKFHDIQPGSVVRGDCYEVSLVRLNHPSSSYAYRIDSEGQSMVFATDTEHYKGRLDAGLLDLAREVDLLIYDCQYTPSEYYGLNGHIPRIGWGHSTMQEGVKFAKAANVKHLILFHHDPSHDDNVIQKIEAEARTLFSSSTAAYEGMEIDLGCPAAPRSLFG